MAMLNFGGGCVTLKTNNRHQNPISHVFQGPFFPAKTQGF